jgi:hypothetical protein
MSTIVRISTDWQARIHWQADADVAAHDCIQVELPPYTLETPILVYREGASMDALEQEALRMLDFLRSQPRTPVLPEKVFQPFGVLTKRNLAALCREHDIRREMMIGACTDRERERWERIDPKMAQEWHELRVAALGRALELLDNPPRPIEPSFSLPPARH